MKAEIRYSVLIVLMILAVLSCSIGKKDQHRPVVTSTANQNPLPDTFTQQRIMKLIPELKFSATIDGVPCTYSASVEKHITVSKGFYNGAFSSMLDDDLKRETAKDYFRVSIGTFDSNKINNPEALRSFFNNSLWPYEKLWGYENRHWVSIMWMDSNDQIWSTGGGSQPNSTFKIDNAMVYIQPDGTYSTLVTISFSCTLYDRLGEMFGKSKKLTNGKYVGVF